MLHVVNVFTYHAGNVTIYCVSKILRLCYVKIKCQCDITLTSPHSGRFDSSCKCNSNYEWPSVKRQMYAKRQHSNLYL